jgi:hypothetical protein
MTTRYSVSRQNLYRAASVDQRVDALVEALRRLWNAVKERLVGVNPTPAPVPVPVRTRR